MAIRTIEYAVSVNGIVPASQQFGGTQGDHNVTELKFTLSEPLRSAITSSAKGTVVYRFDGYDGSGGVRSTEPQELTQNPCVYVLEEWITRYGGNIQVYLVITDIKNGTEKELYSFPAVLNLKSRPNHVDRYEYQSITALYEGTKQNAQKAEAAADEAERILDDIGGAIPDIDVTEVSDGVEITVSDLDGIQTVKVRDGEKGPQGDKGDKGDTGPQGPKGDKGDPSDVSSDFVSNALKGSVSGEVVAIKDVSPLPHTVLVKASGGGVGEETLTKTVEVTEKMQTVLLDNPASSVRVVVESGSNCVGGLVPMVDGDNLTASGVREQVVLWPPWSYDEASGGYDLEYTISGKTLSWSGTKYYIFDINQSEDISGSIELSTTEQKITGFCQVYGLGDGEDNPYSKHGERDELNMTVKVYESASQVNVKVCGKNILPEYVSKSGVEHAGVTFTTDENGIVTLNGICELESGIKDFMLARDWQLPAGDYYLSGCPDGGAVYKYYLFATIKPKEGAEYYQWDTGNGVGISIGTGDIIKLLSVRIGYKLNGVTITNVKFRPMLAYGTSASEFEPRIETTEYTVDVNKETLVPSRYPSMTFIPDNEDVTLSVEYNRDINKAFAELQAAIISMGGNV